MTLAEISELTMIDRTIQSLHQQLTELYTRRQEITLIPGEVNDPSQLINDREAALDFDAIDLSLSTS